MAILPSKHLFLWDTLKFVFLFLSGCLIPVQWRLCSSALWVSESHSSGDASGCGKVLPPAPSCTGSMFVNSQGFSEGSFPLPFVDVMPSPRLGLDALPFSVAGLGPIWWNLLSSFPFTFPSLRFCDVSLLLALHMELTQSSPSLEVLSTSAGQPLPTAPLAHPLIYPLPLSPFSFVLPPQPEFYILYPHPPTALQNGTLFLHSLSPLQAPGLPHTHSGEMIGLASGFFIGLFHSGT